MKKLLLLLILSFFSAQSFAGSCPDGSDPVKSISADGTYYEYKCGKGFGDERIKNIMIDERIKSITLGAMLLDRNLFDLLDVNLDRIKANNFNSITLVVDWYVENHRDPKILPRYPGQPFPTTDWFKPTLTHDEIEDIATRAKSRGLDVILKMHVDALDWPFGGKGRYAIKPSAVLWKHYIDFATDTARIAEKINAKMLFIGTETHNLTKTNPANWVPVIQAVQQIYSGPISYAASFNGKANFSASEWATPKSCGACAVKIWDQVDYIGFEPYAGLTLNKDPTLEEMKAGVRKIIDKVIIPLSEKHNKRIILPELNFYSFDGVNSNPISLDTSRYRVEQMPPDHEEQSMAYQAWLEVLNEADYQDKFVGVILWGGYLREESEKLKSWVHNDNGDLIWGKKAEVTICEAFKAWTDVEKQTLTTEEAQDIICGMVAISEEQTAAEIAAQEMMDEILEEMAAESGQ